MLNLLIGAALALLSQAVVGTLRSNSAFDGDRAKRVAGLWAMNLGLIVMLMGIALGYSAGVRGNPMNCADVADLTSSLQGLNVEAAGMSEAVTHFGQVLDRRFTVMEAYCATKRRGC